MSSEQQKPVTTISDQMALLEKSYQLAAKYMPSGGGQPSSNMTSASDGETASERKAVSATRNGKAVAFPVAPVSEQVVSALAQPMSDSTFRSEYVKGRNYLFHTAIGFRNDAGGLELRNHFFKGCIPPKDISLKCNSSDVCSVFEGFMDYLSAMQLGIIDSDWLVLNSVSNVEKAVKALQGYERIECFLDNDDAGRRTFQRLHDCFGEKVIDRSALYADYKDLNEFLLSKNAGNNV